MESLQRDFPASDFVKAFNHIGAALMDEPPFKEKPTVFICGDSDDAKLEVASIVEELGFEAADMGSAVSARAIEPLCILWLIPGFLHDDWRHAFRLLRQ